jgi:hypothetical protein
MEKDRKMEGGRRGITQLQFLIAQFSKLSINLMMDQGNKTKESSQVT